MILVRQSYATKTHENKLVLSLILSSDAPEGRLCSMSFYVQMTL